MRPYHKAANRELVLDNPFHEAAGATLCSDEHLAFFETATAMETRRGLHHGFESQCHYFQDLSKID